MFGAAVCLHLSPPAVPSNSWIVPFLLSHNIYVCASAGFTPKEKQYLVTKT